MLGFGRRARGREAEPAPAPEPFRAAIIIATYGDRDHWDRVSMPAILSAEAQTLAPAQVMRVHGETLHGVRNRAAIESTAEWLCFLDADDELDPGYLAGMAAAAGDLRYPRVLTVNPDGSEEGPATLGPHRLIERNFMCIGTMIRRRDFLRAGGFRGLPMIEDWDLWIRCVLAGAVPGLAHDAVYRWHDVPESRNKNDPIVWDVINQIRERYQAEFEAKFPAEAA